MTTPKIASRQQWLEARAGLLAFARKRWGFRRVSSQGSDEGDGSMGRLRRRDEYDADA